MRQNIIFIAAAVLAVSSAARAAEVDFDGAKSGSSLDILEAVSGFSSDRAPGHGSPGGHPPPPKPGHPGSPQPNHPGPLPSLPGPLPPLPGTLPPPTNPHPFPPPPHYEFGGFKESCRTLQFNSQSPHSVTETMTLEEYGEMCQPWGTGHSKYCSPVTKQHRREVTVNIGPRKLESWETERLEVCMTRPEQVGADTAGMLYEYAVSARSDDGLFKRATVFTLVPGAKKPSQPAATDLIMTFAGITSAGDVRMALQDRRAEYFNGEKITIAVEGASLPEISLHMTPEQVMASVTKISVTAAFDVAQSYEIKLMDAPKPGKYSVKVTFSRSGPLSSGTEATLDAAFEIR